MYEEKLGAKRQHDNYEESNRAKNKNLHRKPVQLSPRLIAVLKKNMGRIIHAFKRYDTNGDGMLDKQEFSDMLSKYTVAEEGQGITDQDIDMMFSVIYDMSTTDCFEDEPER